MVRLIWLWKVVITSSSTTSRRTSTEIDRWHMVCATSERAYSQTIALAFKHLLLSLEPFGDLEL